MSVTDMEELKRRVLKNQYNYLVQNLGDPSRYIPYMIAEDILDSSDKEVVRSKVTSKEKAEVFVDLLRSRENMCAFDEFVQALLEERVQSHIARRLQESLKLEVEHTQLPPTSITKSTGEEELISSVTSYPISDPYHTMNEEVTPCAEPVDGPKPPPPPTESLIKTNMVRSDEDLLPPMPPPDLASYNTHTTSLHMQETFMPELDSLRREVEGLRVEKRKLEVNNKKLLDDNTHLRTLLSQREEQLAKLKGASFQNGVAPIPEQNTGTTKQSEMVPKGSGTY